MYFIFILLLLFTDALAGPKAKPKILWGLEIEFSHPALREGRNWLKEEQWEFEERIRLESQWAHRFGSNLIAKLKSTPLKDAGSFCAGVDYHARGVKISFLDGFWIEIKADPGVVEVTHKKSSLEELESRAFLFEDFVYPTALESELTPYGSTHFNFDLESAFGDKGGLSLWTLFFEFTQRPELSFGTFSKDFRNSPPILSHRDAEKTMKTLQKFGRTLAKLERGLKKEERKLKKMPSNRYIQFKKNRKNYEKNYKKFEKNVRDPLFDFFNLYTNSYEISKTLKKLSLFGSAHYSPLNFRLGAENFDDKKMKDNFDFSAFLINKNDVLSESYSVPSHSLLNREESPRGEFRNFRTFLKFKDNFLAISFLENFLVYSSSTDRSLWHYFHHKFYDVTHSRASIYTPQEMVDLFYITCKDIWADFDQFRPLLLPELQGLEPSRELIQIHFDDSYWSQHPKIAERVLSSHFLTMNYLGRLFQSEERFYLHPWLKKVIDESDHDSLKQQFSEEETLRFQEKCVKFVKQS